MAGDRHEAITFQWQDNIKEPTCVCVPVVLRFNLRRGVFCFCPSRISWVFIIYSVCTLLPLLLGAFNIFSFLPIKKKYDKWQCSPWVRFDKYEFIAFLVWQSGQKKMHKKVNTFLLNPSQIYTPQNLTIKRHTFNPSKSAWYTFLAHHLLVQNFRSFGSLTWHQNLRFWKEMSLNFTVCFPK